MMEARPSAPHKGLSLVRRTGFALRGIRFAFHAERSFRTQVMAAVAAGVATALLRPGWVWGSLIALAIALVLMAELFNTALEQALDGLHPEHARFVAAAKDCAAGAVLVLSALSVFTFLAMLFDTGRL